MTAPIRVRFAPSPTGDLHLGNIRAALMNYLFARQNNGTFIVRIEDTDMQRNLNQSDYTILKDLRAFGLTYDEGLDVGGDAGPYLQSQRVHFYQQILVNLTKMQKVYRCFCPKDQLDAKREQARAQSKPPRYDRTCRNLCIDAIQEKLMQKQPFIWRFKLNSDAVYQINTMERGTISFAMQHFSDFALTRPDGSFVFVFTNFVDDYLMKISHVIRGEDHLSNTAGQVALFQALGAALPIFWHLPMLCNAEGKKLSKRDHDFSFYSLRKRGYLPQAICNYLACVGGSFDNEIQNLDELTHSFDFSDLHATSSIKYDINKLTWFNHQWIIRLPINKLLEYAKPFLIEQIPIAKRVSDQLLIQLFEIIKSDIKTLQDSGNIARFYFERPEVSITVLQQHVAQHESKNIITLIKKVLSESTNKQEFLDKLRSEAKSAKFAIRNIFKTLRYLLTGSFDGIGIQDLCTLLDQEEIKNRLTVL